MELLARPDSQLVCALCRDALAHAPAGSCARCGVRWHEECRAPLDACPTLGCRPEPAPCAGPPSATRGLMGLLVLVTLTVTGLALTFVLALALGGAVGVMGAVVLPLEASLPLGLAGVPAAVIWIGCALDDRVPR